MDTPTPAPPAQRAPTRPEVPITTTPPVKRERRWSVVALCIVLAVLCALGAAAAVTSASDRTPVLAIARDVPAGQTLSEADLTVTEVSAATGLTPVPAREKSQMVGKRTAVDLRKGGLLTASQLRAGSSLGDTRQQVGVLVKRGQAPAGTLVPGDKVEAVTIPAQGEEAAKSQTPTPTIKAQVVSVSRPDASGTVVVNLAVDTTDGPVLAARAAAGQIALVRAPRSS